ncbi:MAG: RlmE family RNA methyltransferase [Candidatus Nanoarchaeia archaeon]|nr:RlmE family RNA methyltransferase [Candidatus Nanoarchaeia archaeon]
MRSKNKLTLKAKREGYKARSAYKLIEIDRKFNIIKQNSRVLDIGCWPGSWLQVSSRKAKEAIGIDLKQTHLKIPNVKTYVLDVNSDKVLSLGKFDVIISDIAPNTSGKIEIDQYKSYELSLRSLEIAKHLLKEKGNFLVKIFQGEESNLLLNEMKKYFKVVKVTKPQASKKTSKEVYFIGLNFSPKVSANSPKSSSDESSVEE